MVIILTDMMIMIIGQWSSNKFKYKTHYIHMII